MLEAARSVGIATFENQNGRMMESAGGASFIDTQCRLGKRQSVFRSYVFPCMDRPNLTVLTQALVTRITFEGTSENTRATGIEMVYEGQTHCIRAGYPPITIAIRLATFATVPVKRFCSAVKPVSKGDPLWAWAAIGSKRHTVAIVAENRLHFRIPWAVFWGMVMWIMRGIGHLHRLQFSRDMPRL
jgi:hypothetical protein